MHEVKEEINIDDKGATARISGNYELISEEEREIAERIRKNTVYADATPVKKRNSIYESLVKRIIDVFLSSIALVVFSPIMCIGAIGTFVFHGSPIIYKQTRVGKGGKQFQMYKFKSLIDKHDHNGKMLSVDKRVTPFGKFMRQTSIDEIPNFVNVFKGDMSVIGPRPMPVFFHDRMSERHKKRIAVKPGLESPIRFIPDLNGGEEADYQFHTKFENDIWYVEHISFITDVMMTFELIKLVFSRKERNQHAVTGTNFVGYDKAGRAISMRVARKYPQNL